MVAKVGGTPIFAKQVLAEAQRTGKPAREALASLIEEDVAAEAAHSLGRSLPSSDDADVKTALVQRMLERDFEPGLQQNAIPDKTLRPLYDRAHDSLVHPPLVEVGVLAFYTGALMKDEPRKARGEAAKDLVAYLAKKPIKTIDDFAAIAEDPQWSRRGVTYLRTVQGPDQPFSRAIGNEVVKLRAPGDITPLMSDETGFYLARHIGVKPAENLSFEQVREKLAAGYFPRWTQEQFLAFTSKLAQTHKVAVYFDRGIPNEQGR